MPRRWYILFLLATVPVIAWAVPTYITDPLDGNRIAGLDNIFKAILVVDTAHNKVHQGEAFIVDVADLDMANAETLILAFKTPAGTKRVHFVVEFATLVGGFVEVLEGPVWTTNTGTLTTIYNRKREASMASSMLLEDKTSTPAFTATDSVLANPTITDPGTTIRHLFAFGVKNQSSAGSRDSEEILAQPDQTYAFRFTAVGGNNKVELDLDWYEHEDE